MSQCSESHNNGAHSHKSQSRPGQAGPGQARQAGRQPRQAFVAFYASPAQLVSGSKLTAEADTKARTQSCSCCCCSNDNDNIVVVVVVVVGLPSNSTIFKFQVMSQANDDNDEAGELNERPNKQPSGDQATDSRLYVRPSARPSRQPESQSSSATTATATTRIVCPKAKAKPSREAPEPQSRSAGPSS